MATKRLLLGLPPLLIAVCTLGMLLHVLTVRCAFGPWLCSERGMPMDLLTMARAPLLLFLILILWGIVAGGRQLMRTRRALRGLHRIGPQELPGPFTDLVARLDLQGRVDLVLGTAPTAFCSGLLRPRICVTTALYDLLTFPEVEAVLRHERHHLRRHDPLRTLLWTILDHSCWWLAAGGQRALYLRELAADRAVIAEQGRRPLVRALVTLLTYGAGTDVPPVGLAISRLSISDARIDQLLERSPVLPPPVHWNHWSLLPLATIAIALACSVVTG